MILLTTGTQLPFDRLVRALDSIAPELQDPIFGQIGSASYRPENFEWVETLDPENFDRKLKSARAIVSHAGIGTVLAAQRNQKPIILFPREARFGEHRNDHQLATCAQLKARKGIAMAKSAEELKVLLSSTELVSADAVDVSEKQVAFVAALSLALEELTQEN